VSTVAARVARVQKRLERLRGNALKVMAYAIEEAAAHPEEVKAAAKMPKGEAPMYLHMAAAIAADTARVEAARAPTTTNNLNVVIIGQAPTAEAWLEQTKQVRQLAPAAKPPIDVEPAK
jgi:hypothetical protein